MRLLDEWREEDRRLLYALKVGFVVGVLALEAIVLLSFAYLMWQAAS